MYLSLCMCKEKPYLHHILAWWNGISLISVWQGSQSAELQRNILNVLQSGDKSATISFSETIVKSLRITACHIWWYTLWKTAFEVFADYLFYWYQYELWENTYFGIFTSCIESQSWFHGLKFYFRNVQHIFSMKCNEWVWAIC